MKRILYLSLFLLLFTSVAHAKKILNLYAWTGEIPDEIISQFEKETGITVNFATYENNEVMYAKLRASKNAGYDIVMPSGYFVDRMRRFDMLEPLDKSKLPNWKNLNPEFLHPAYDPQTMYSVPFIWGITGIFVNEQYFSQYHIRKWSDLWNEEFSNELLLLDDSREVFSMALLTLGYPANDKDPQHIKQAYLKLKSLMQNVKVFSTETVVAIIIDEDANAGMAWNGDAYKASKDNPDIKFIYPEEGYVIWVDNFAIPKNARHKEEAYTFLNYILRPDVAKQIALSTNYPIANLAGQKLLPAEILNNPVIYPPKNIMRKAQFQTDPGDATLALYEQYWEELKMEG